MKLDLYIRLLDTYRPGPAPAPRTQGSSEARANPLSRFQTTHDSAEDDIWEAPYDVELSPRDLSQAQKRAIHVRTLNEAYAEGMSGQFWHPESLSAQVEKKAIFNTKNFEDFLENLTSDSSKFVAAHSALNRDSAVRLLLN